MSNLDKISAGIAARQGGGSLTKVYDFDEMASAKEFASNRLGALTKKYEKLSEEIARHTAQIDEDFERSITVSENEYGVKQKLPKSEQTLLKKSFDKKKAELRKQLSREFRDDLAETKKGLEAQLSAMRDSEFLADSHAWATLHALGSMERERMIRDLEILGDEAFVNAARQAFTSGDRTRIAAIVVVNDRKPTKERKFSSKELAEIGFGTDADKMREAIHVVEHNLSKLRQIESELMGGHGSSREKIKRGLDPLDEDAED